MEILVPVLVVLIIGVVLGLGLSFADKFMSVPVDEKQSKIRECLPGANCGACGYSGCDGYAAALAAGEAEPDKCAPGGEATAAALGEVLGVKIEAQKKTAFIACGGKPGIVKDTFEYTGLKTCAAAALTGGGPIACEFGCLGYGDCMRACDFGAITMKDGRPCICEDLCAACGKCVKTCPKSIISLIPKGAKTRVNCSNKKKGPTVLKSCDVSCIACGMCERACEAEAIKVVDNLAVIDYNSCTACGKCKDACPRKVII
ncbi:MAG: RnfABCDGE type electron transport complex subunit B [Clostridia bacterium]|nr:RnfABCDGE type electron transport complex subunit B [Clostridia bacterium]